jgi:hypothetical protein
MRDVPLRDTRNGIAVPLPAITQYNPLTMLMQSSQTSLPLKHTVPGSPPHSAQTLTLSFG